MRKSVSYIMYVIYLVNVYFLCGFVCTIEERGEKVIELCNVKIDVIYLCQL